LEQRRHGRLHDLVALDCTDEAGFPSPVGFKANIDQVGFRTPLGFRTPQIDLVALSLDAVRLARPDQLCTRFAPVANDLVESGYASDQGPRDLVKLTLRRRESGEQRVSVACGEASTANVPLDQSDEI
jgi:hypothetical protein